MSSGFGGGAGAIRYTIEVDDAQAIQKLQGVSQQMTNLGNSTETTTQQIQKAPAAIDEVSRSQQSFSSNLRSAAFGITAAAGGIIGLVQQYTSLRRAQNTLERSQQREKDLVVAIEKQRRKYNEAVEKSGKNSQEAKDELAKLNSMEQKHGILTERNEIMQEQLNQRMMDFAVNIVPTSIGVIAGLAQTFSILGVGRGGTGGIKGVTMMLGKFFLPLAAIGIGVYALKTNLFGFRDAMDGIGKAIGDALPFMRPLLNNLKNIGIVLGIIPGDADKAKLLLSSFMGDIKKWASEIGNTFAELFSKLSSGDISGAIDVIKSSVVKGFKSLGVDIQKEVDAFKKDPIKYTVNALTVVDKFLGIKGKDGKDYSFTEAIKAGFKKRFEEAKGNPITLLGNFNDFFNVEIGQIDPMTNLKIGGFTGEQWVYGTMAKIRVGALERWEQADKNPIKLFADFNEFFNLEIGQFDPFADQTAQIQQDIGASFDKHVLTPIMTEYGKVKTEAQNFIKTNPIMQKLAVGDILGAITLSLAKLRQWFDQNIGGPIIKAFEDTKKRIVDYITKNPLSDALGNLLSKVPKSNPNDKKEQENQKNFMRKPWDTQSAIRNGFSIQPAFALGSGDMFGDQSVWSKDIAGRIKPIFPNGGFASFGSQPTGTDFRNMPISTEGDREDKGKEINGFDKVARQIVQITTNLNQMARAIVQVTKNINQWARATVTQTKDNDQLARTIAQLTKNNNSYARTAVTVIKDLNQYARATAQNTKNNNTFAKTIVETTKDFNTMARATNQNTKNLNTFARAVNQTTNNVKKLTNALNDIPSNVNVKIRVGLSGAGSPFLDQLI